MKSGQRPNPSLTGIEVSPYPRQQEYAVWKDGYIDKFCTTIWDARRWLKKLDGRQDGKGAKREW